MKWFRFYAEFVDDPKIAMMSDTDQLLWVKALCLANDEKKRGFIALSDDEICWKLRCNSEVWKHAVDKFRAKGMLEHSESGYKITNWDSRQFESDNSTARVKSCRQRKKATKEESETFQKQPCNVTETFQKQPCNVTETPPDTDTDTEQIQNRTDPEQKEMRNSKFRRSLSVEKLNSIYENSTFEEVSTNAPSETLGTTASQKRSLDNPKPIAVDQDSAAGEAIFQKCWNLYGALRQDTMRDTAGRKQDASHQWRSQQFTLEQAQAYLDDLQGFTLWKRAQFAKTGAALSLPKFETYLSENRIEDYRDYIAANPLIQLPPEEDIAELHRQRLAAAKAEEARTQKTAYIPPPPDFPDNRVSNFFAAERAKL